MKKQLLLGSALLAAVTAFPQSGRVARPAGVSMADNSKRIAARIAAENRYAQSTLYTPNQYASAAESNDGNPTASKTNSFVSSWNIIGGSMNAYGVVITHSKPLQYNEDLNAVTFVHRGSSTYPASPTPIATAKSGVIMAEITQNWGATWDSTLLWNNDNFWGRYPQGGILNSATGNTNIATALLVGNAAVNNAAGWVGNGFFAKPLSSYNNVAAATNTYIPTLSALGKSDFTVYDFQVTDDGKAVAVGYVNNDPNGTSTAQFGYRGARVVKGMFVSGAMVWSSDSIIPNVMNTTANAKILQARPRMAWSENGMVGYVVHIGTAANATLNNRAYQPIIHRTGDGGISWAPVNNIDFNLPAMTTVTNQVLSPTSNSNVTLPYFDIGEGMGMTVDKNNKLHITSILRGTSADHPDSLSYVFIFNNADGEEYWYGHRPGLRPTVYDFVGDGLPNSPWSVTVIDSLSSEAPGTDAVNDTRGYDTNPWDEVDNGKVAVEARLQTSRTADGNYIVYTWGESDTNFTSGPYFKWNELPNIKARLMNVTTGIVNPVEINVTRPGANNPFLTTNVNVSSRAYLHFASPKCALAQTIAVGPSGPAIVLPLTTSRPYGVPLQQSTDIVHRYMSAILNFGGLTQNDIVVPAAPLAPPTGTVETAISENAMSSVKQSVLYPNPAKDNSTLALGLVDRSKVDISVMNVVGQVVKTQSTTVDAGQNTINVDLSGLSKGVYMVNVKIGTAVSTKKLIVE